MFTGIRAGMAKIFNLRLRGYPGLRSIFMKFGHRDGSGKVRYGIYMVFLAGKLPNKRSYTVLTNPTLLIWLASRSMDVYCSWLKIFAECIHTTPPTQTLKTCTIGR